MSLSVNNNAAALNTYRNLTSTQGSLKSSLEKLSSGYRINRAADDAAGLAISEGLRSQINGLTQASRNAQDGINVVQTAEGALNESTSILQRMRTLSVQAASTGSLNADAKGNIQSEISELKNELNRIASTTTFNGTKLLDGNFDGKFQVGANSGESINVAVTTAMGTVGLGIDGVDVTTTAAGNIQATATAANNVAASYSAGTGVAGKAEVAFGDLTKSESFDKLDGTLTIGKTSFDLSTVQFAEGSSATTRLGVLQSALNTAFAGEVTAGTITAVPTITAATATNVQFTGVAPTSAADVASKTVKFTRASGADAALGTIDAALKTVSTVRANLGAKQNRFEHTINNLNVSVENLTASESAIRDTDMASEMVKYTSKQILSQAGTAMLAQAKSLPQSILSLLQN